LKKVFKDMADERAEEIGYFLRDRVGETGVGCDRGKKLQS